jgi:hypothetical protein
MMKSLRTGTLTPSFSTLLIGLIICDDTGCSLIRESKAIIIISEAEFDFQPFEDKSYFKLMDVLMALRTRLNVVFNRFAPVGSGFRALRENVIVP